MACHIAGCTVEDGDELHVSKLIGTRFPHSHLRGGSKPLSHSFSPSQLTSLEAICDTFIPSLLESAAPEDASTGSKLFKLSASQAGIVTEVAGMLCAWTTRTQFILIYLALILLSTRLGTFLLCGLDSVTKSFPFLHPFPALSLQRRESILLAWSRSVIFVLQMFYKVTKCYTVFNFFSRADEKGNNPAWETIGYEVPKLVTEDHEEPLPNHLEARLVDAEAPDFETRLTKLGCVPLDNLDHLRVPEGDPLKRQELGIKCDVVVVGSGSGGGVIAARLAEEGYKVIVLEKGGYYPPSGLSLLEGPSMKAMYEQSGALTTQDGSVIFLAATTLGGGTAVNWSASLKTPKHVLEEWSRLGLESYTSREYMQAMESVCTRLRVQENCTEESFQNQVLRRGCTALGYPVGHLPRNAGKDHHCGSCGFGCPATASARKQSGVDTWLNDAARHGAVIVTGCQVDRVLTTTSPAAGDRKMFRSAGTHSHVGEYDFYIEARVTVVACGSLFTPPLLTRSGLRNPSIGRNLCIHPVVAVWGYFPRKDADALPGRSYHGGIMTSFSDVVGNWDGSGYGCILETPCLHPGTFSALVPWRSGADFKRRMVKYPRTATLIVLNRDRGRGTVKEQDGKLLLDYPLFYKDRDSLVSATEKALRVLVAAGAEEVGTDCFEGEIFSTRNSSQEDFEKFVSRVTGRMFSGLSTPIMSAHQLGSCRMGVDPLSSAVDRSCETWEVEGLFVGDGSVLPTASGVNPMITIQSIAYCTSSSVVRYLRQGLSEV